MNANKFKVSLLLFILFVCLFLTKFKPKMFFISFIITTFFILLEKTQLLQNRSIAFPFKPVIIGSIIVFGLFYINKLRFKKERFQDKNEAEKLEKNDTPKTKKIELDDRRIAEIENNIEKKVLGKLKENKSLLENTQNVIAFNEREFNPSSNSQSISKKQLNFDRQNLSSSEYQYKIEQEINTREKKIKQKNQPLDKKNLLLFKQNLVKHIPNIIEELQTNITKIIEDDSSEDSKNIFNKMLRIIETTLSTINKKDRVTYVGITSLFISFSLMLLEISL